VSCSPAGPPSRAFIDRHGVGRRREDRGTGLFERPSSRRIHDLKGDPMRLATRRPTDPVDELGLG
jgi:hypothetical protein